MASNSLNSTNFRLQLVCPILAAFLVLISQLGCFADNPEPSTKQNLFFSTFPPSVTKYNYKFTDQFDEWRQKQLLSIQELDGSVQTIESIEHVELLEMQRLVAKYMEIPVKEFFNLKLGKFLSLVREFETRQNNVKIRLDKFKTKHNKIAKASVNSLNSLKSDLPLIVECKKFMRHLMSEAGESSWLNIFNFIDHGGEDYVPLKIIFELSKVQSEELDELINADMYKEHKENSKIRGTKKVGQNQLLHAVVEGAGPAGLFATFQTFLAGMHVRLVNDRPEQYRRSRIFYLDPKWMCQLRYLLGTWFDKLFGEAKSGVIHAGEIGQVNCRMLEEIMLKRLFELGSYVQHEASIARGIFPFQTSQVPPLEVQFETEFVQIANPSRESPHFLGILQTPNRHGNTMAGEFNKLWIEARAKRILAEATEMAIGEAEAVKKAREELLEQKLKNTLKVLRGKHGRQVGKTEKILDYRPSADEAKSLISPEKWAELEVEGKVLALQEHKPVRVDLLVCAGGSNDRIRDKYLGAWLLNAFDK